MHRICITGGRDFTDRALAWQVLDLFHSRMNNRFILVHGGARGADSIAGEWAKEKGIQTEVFCADWNKHGKRAGPIRNKEMLAAGIDLLIAFPGGRGTEHMKSICRSAGISVLTADKMYAILSQNNAAMV